MRCPSNYPKNRKKCPEKRAESGLVATKKAGYSSRPFSFTSRGLEKRMNRIRLAAAATVVWCAAALGSVAQEPELQLERLPPLAEIVLQPEEIAAPTPQSAPSSSAFNLHADQSAEVPVVIEAAPGLPKLWSGSFDLGLNGSNGNTELFNFRFNLAATRETDFTKLALKSNYMRMQSEGEETGNRLFFEGRNEWKIDESLWTWYVHETTEYDEFRNWRTRVGMDTGLGYNFIKNDRTALTLRFGPSVSHEFRGPAQDWVPELAYGLQLNHKISELQKLMFQIDYFPDLRDMVEYRMNTQASWEIVLDQVNNLSLKLSAISRYDTTPEGDSPDDLDYAATLLWSF